MYLLRRSICCILVLLGEIFILSLLLPQLPLSGALGIGITLLAVDAAALWVWLLLPCHRMQQRYLRLAESERPEAQLSAELAESAAQARLFDAVQESIRRQDLLDLTIEKSKILALQNQINPHFLYNTLEAIRSDAIIYGADEVADITKALSTFFRYTISSLSGLVTLADELHNVQDYLAIQRYRFGDKLQVQISRPEDWVQIEKLYLPKLTLQPIIENSIYHGLEPSEHAGTISIWVNRTPEVLLICIADDGVGMDEAAVTELNHALDHEDGRKSGIALRNVHQRIRLLFGKEYGVHLVSAPGYGTETWLTLPVCEEDFTHGT